MTPQLQQAIKLLQLSTLDLQQEIQQALESNMMLEVDEEEVVSQEKPEPKEDVSDQITSEGSQTDMPDELPVDTTWDDVYEASGPVSSAADTETVEFETFRSKVETLIDHLMWQLEMIPISDRDHVIATAIIDAVNDDGYLGLTVEDIFNGLQDHLEDLEDDEVTAVLHRVQNFDPAGVAAADLSDCLKIQLLQLNDETLWKAEALELVTQYLDLLAGNDLNKLKKRLEVNEAELREVIALIRTLDPKPGAYFKNYDSDYIVPDVFVNKINGQWLVSLNPEIAPKLRVNSVYSGLIKRADNSRENTSMKDHLQEARWFIKSLHSRNDTLLRVARCIVERQGDFFEHGAVSMKPMILRDIAEELELHESTISRVTTQKYMQTPNGIIEFKYFFSSHVSTESGGECSATAIRALIKELVASETPSKPLSDSKITEILKDKGINVARRTIAKYRESLSIPSSSQRKRLL